MTRHQERELIFTLLYEYTYYTELDTDSFFENRESVSEETIDDNVKKSFCGVLQNEKRIDGIISEYSNGWKVSRLSRVTKSVLRLAIYELLFTETPPKVIINEAVELSKTYAEDKAPSFVNGILNKFARDEGKIDSAENE